MKITYTVCDTTRLPITSRCAHCGYGPLDGVTEVDARTPDEAARDFGEIVTPPVSAPYPGAISICVNCGGLGVFAMSEGNRLGVRAMTAGEVAELQANPFQWRLTQKMQRLIKQRKKGK